ncbi:MAG TPA: hypothetical protein VGF59_12525, partial [Bryobacteraceae bacterium]
MRRAVPLVAAAALWVCHAASAPPHPLAPLTAGEIRDAARLFRTSGKFPGGGRFSTLTLQEPPKDLVLRNAAAPRRAFAVIYDPANNRTFEAVADLGAAKVESWREVQGVQPAIGAEDSGIADGIVRSDPRWRAALRARGINNPDRIVTEAWAAGYFGLPGTAGPRIVRVLSFDGGQGSNYDGHPVEGLVAHVNLTTGRVIDLLDTARDVPVSRENFDLDPRSNTPLRTAPATLHITQPDGPGWQIENGEVRWQKWHFRYALHPREGLVLYTVGYEDGGRVRPILYRGSLSEMVVPYGDPGGGWFFRNSFDAGELGLGQLASSLRVGADCPENCALFDAVVADGAGVARTIPRAVALYERDAGVAWKHGENTRRARELVLGYLSQAGNYEYGFDWVFHQDGTLEMRAALTGIMSVKGIADGAHDPYSHPVAKNIAAPHHQHFFTFRLDMDVDGARPNTVVEMNSAPVPAGPKNPYGGAFTMEETPLRTERDAQRKLSLETSRRWIVES